MCPCTGRPPPYGAPPWCVSGRLPLSCPGKLFPGFPLSLQAWRLLPAPAGHRRGYAVPPPSLSRPASRCWSGFRTQWWLCSVSVWKARRQAPLPSPPGYCHPGIPEGSCGALSPCIRMSRIQGVHNAPLSPCSAVSPLSSVPIRANRYIRCHFSSLSRSFHFDGEPPALRGVHIVVIDIRVLHLQALQPLSVDARAVGGIIGDHIFLTAGP